MSKLKISEPTWVLMCEDGSFVKQPTLRKVESGGWQILVEFTVGDAEKRVPEVADMARRMFDEEMKGETYVGTRAIRYEKTASLLSA